MISSGEAGQKKRGRLKRILLTLIAVILVFCLVSMVATWALFRFIFARSDHAAVGMTYSQALSQDYPRQTVEFSSGDNILAGYLYAPEKPVALVVAHGLGADGDTHLPEILYFMDNSLAVLAFDGTGVGQSTGESMVGLQQMALDLIAAIDYAATLPQLGKLPVLLYGHSMGGYATAIAAQQRPQVQAAVSISGFDSPMDMMVATGKDYAGDVALLGYPFLYLHNAITFGDYANCTAVDAINRADAEFLIVHGSQDEVIALEDSILGQKEQITNPAVTYLLISEPLRNGHTALWLSPEAAAYSQQAHAQLDALKQTHGGKLSQAEFQEFYDGLDAQALYRLDESFMSTVVSFYLAAI